MPVLDIYCTRELPPAGLALLRASGRSFQQRPGDGPISRAELLSVIPEVRALVVMLTDRIDAEILAAACHLEVLSTVAVGVDNLDLQAARAAGVVVTNTPGVLTDATADLAFALLLAVARHLVTGDALVRSGGFIGWGPQLLTGGDLCGATLGIIGAGRIGTAVAHRARAFGMEVVHTPRQPGTPKSPDLGEPLSVDDLLTRSDYVSLHCPLTPATFHLLDETRLRRMKPTAYLINTARGPVVDEVALARALREGWLAGAALDVYEREPAVNPHLIGLPNVVLAPHLGSATVRTRARMAEMAVTDALAVLDGRPPLYRVA